MQATPSQHCLILSAVSLLLVTSILGQELAGPWLSRSSNVLGLERVSPYHG